MSFEGYYQVLCPNGHYTTFDAVWDTVYSWSCPICGLSAAWYNVVDLTNGSYDDDGTRIDGYVHLEVLKEANCACDKCGNVHGLAPAIYKIPEDAGKRL